MNRNIRKHGPARLSTLATALALVAASSVVAADELSVVGSWSSLPLHKQYESVFWGTTLSEKTDMTAAVTTFDQMGVAGGDVLRMLGDGVFDVGMTVADYTVGDAPALEGLDVPLVATEADEARAMVEAARPMVEGIMEEAFGAKLLAIAPYPPQVVFCNAEVASLADLEGKKIRGSGRMTTKFLEALGAEGVNVAFSEVPGALERGVVDCAVTGSGSGYSAGWWEVSTHLMTIPLGGWDPVVTAMNLDTWNGLSAEEQETLTSLIASDFEAPAWGAAGAALDNDVACLTGNGECSSGDAASMVLVAPSEADIEQARSILVETVLPEWAERAGPEAAAMWNDSVGKTVGVEIPL